MIVDHTLYHKLNSVLPTHTNTHTYVYIYIDSISLVLYLCCIECCIDLYN